VKFLGYDSEANYYDYDEVHTKCESGGVDLPSRKFIKGACSRRSCSYVAMASDLFE